jgi:hypothetical protein
VVNKSHVYKYSNKLSTCEDFIIGIEITGRCVFAPGSKKLLVFEMISKRSLKCQKFLNENLIVYAHKFISLKTDIFLNHV